MPGRVKPSFELLTSGNSDGHLWTSEHHARMSKITLSGCSGMATVCASKC